MKGRLAFLAALVLLAGVAALAPAPGSAVSDYTGSTGQPCIACHVTGTSPDLNARGQAFAAVPTHRTDPVGAWAEVERAFPEASSLRSSGFPFVPALLGLLVVGGTVYLLAVQARRRAA